MQPKNIIQKYIQYSKKITLFGMIQWCVLALLSLAIVITDNILFHGLNEYETEVIKSVITWSAAVAFISVSTYEANSAIEKVVKQKIENMITGTQVDVSEEESGNG